MPDYRGRRRKSQDDPEYDPEYGSEGASWIDRGPLAYEEGEEEYDKAPRRYSTEDHHYRRGGQPPDQVPPGHGAPGHGPAGHPGYPPAGQGPAGQGPAGHPEYPPPGATGYREEPTDQLPHSRVHRGYHDDEPTVQTYHSGSAPYEPREEPPARQPYGGPGDEPTGELPYAQARGGYPTDDEPTGRVYPAQEPAGRPYPPPAAPPPPPAAPPPPPAAPPPPTRRPPPADADATVVMPSLRNAPQAPPTPIPELKFNAADTTMLMSAVPYFAPSATPAYTGTIYVSYAASRARMEDEAAARPDAEREGAAASVARSGAIMALGSIVSRLLGFVRVAVLGAVLGAAAVSDTYTTANTIPSMMYELLLGGILTSVLVPVLVRAREHDRDRGQAFAQRLLTLAVITLGAATVLAVAAAPLLTAVMASDNHGAAERTLMTSLAYLLLPEVFFFGIAGILQAVLNTRGHFAAPMWTPILNNIVVIGAAGAFFLVSDQPTLNPANMTSAQILVLGLGTTLGIAAQALALVPALRKVGFRWRWRFDFRKLGLTELGRIAGWMACYVAVSQIGVVVIIRLAYAAGSAEIAGGGKAAGPWIYNNAFLLFMMAHGIVGVSIITALMPRMSAAAANHEYAEVARNISLGTRLTSVVLIPVTAAYLVLGGAITSVLFQYGRYTAADAQAAAVVVAVAGVGLVPFAISQLQTFAFYALTETRTAALINIPVVGTKVIVDIVLYYTLDARYVAAGLMVGNLLSYTLGAVISARMLRARLGPMGQGAVFRTLARLAIAGLVGALACAGVVRVLDGVLGEGKIYDAVQIVVGGGVLMVVYLAAAWAMRVREVSDVMEMLNRKLGGRLPVPGRRGAPAPGQPSNRPGEREATSQDTMAGAPPAGRRPQDDRRPRRGTRYGGPAPDTEPPYGPRRPPPYEQPPYEQRYPDAPPGDPYGDPYRDRRDDPYGDPPQRRRPGPRPSADHPDPRARDPRPPAERGRAPDPRDGRAPRREPPPYREEPPYRDGGPYPGEGPYR